MLILAAVAAAFVPLPRAWIERWYSAGLYLRVQPVVTRVSNLAPFALFDVLIVVTIAAWVITAIVDWRRAVVRVVTGTAGLYLAFLLMWGLNYRRTSLADELEFDSRAVSAEAAVSLAGTAIDQLNTLHDRAHMIDGRDLGPLESSFGRVQRELGGAKTAVAARPKRTLLNPFFRLTGVDGMTDPYFLETLIVTDLLPFERPMDIAHEWGHLAGYADESEASFVGWLTSIHGSAADQYSGWLFLFEELLPVVRQPVVRQQNQSELFHRLGPGPLEDLRALSERRQKNVNRAASRTSERIYDRYLKANRVQAGIASYDEVVRLALGVRFGADWTPRRRDSREAGRALP